MPVSLTAREFDLAICRAIVEAHGGRIWLADGGAGRGTAVRVRIPRAA